MAVKLRGNPAHPYSKGELCPKVNRFLDRVYSPDRILTPLLRTGPKGSGQFAPASWDDALALVASRLHDIVARHGGESVVPWGDAGTQGLLQMSSLDQRFFARLGASRQVDSLCGGTAGAGVAATNGTGKSADPLTITHAKLVLLWGTNTKLTNRHLWPYIQEARAAGAIVVVIDPIRTATAQDADWFIQPLPGTDVALMLAVMHVLIRDGLTDADYIAEHTLGYADLAHQVTDWTPERAGVVCGIDAEVIERLARAYGMTQPAMIRTLIGPEHHEHGAMFFRTLACLPALTGSWKHLGGGLARSVGSWSDVNVDSSVFAAGHLAGGKERRGISMNQLGRALTDPTLSPPVQALFVWNGNPLVTVPNAALTRRGLEREDLLCVVSEQFMTDTARYADVIFPAATQIEQLDVVPSWGHLYLGWNEPAIAPLGESVPNTELWRRLSAAMGFTEPELFASDESLLDAAITGIDRDELRATGVVRVDLPQNFLPYALGGFPTPSGKVEFRNDAMASLGGDALPTYRPAREGPVGERPAGEWPVGERPAAEGLAGERPAGERPAREGPAADAGMHARYPLVLLTPKQHTRFLNSSYSHLPKHGPLEGQPYVELDAADAAARGIADGDAVTVHNDRATLHLTAKIVTRLRAGVAAIPFGWWAAHHGEPMTANALTNDAPTDWGGGVAYLDTLVEVSPISTR